MVIILKVIMISLVINFLISWCVLEYLKRQSMIFSYTLKDIVTNDLIDTLAVAIIRSVDRRKAKREFNRKMRRRFNRTRVR